MVVMVSIMKRSKELILEEYLVLAAKSGDRRATARLVELRGPRMVAHAARLLGNVADAQDAVQDAWIDILRGLGTLREPRAFRSWAMRIVTRRCAGRIDASIKNRALATELAYVTEPTSPASFSEEITALRGAMAGLRPSHRATVALVYLEGFTLAEAAVALDIPVGTVKSRLSHARDALKQKLTEHELKGD